MEFIALDPAEQVRFDGIYNATALEHARELNRYGIDGPAIFRQAQAVLKQGSPVTTCGPALDGA